MPNVQKLLLPEVAAGKRKLDAGEDVAVRRNVAGGVTGAARETLHDVFARWERRGAKFLHVAHQFLATENLLELRPGNAQGEDGCVSVHFRGDGGVKRVGNS